MFKQVFNFKQIFIIGISIFLFSCKSDKIDVPDGFYISGDATPFTTVLKFGQMQATVVENDNNVSRAGLYEIYMALEANKTFTITKVVSSKPTVYGQAAGFTTVIQAATNDEMGAMIQKGKYAEGGTFQVSTSGLYHIVLDEQSTNIVIMPVTKWTILGSATPKDIIESELLSKSAFNKDTLIYEIKDLALLEGEFKFRHSGAWKQTIVDEPLIKVNTSFGGTLTSLTSGGAGIKISNSEMGKYSVTATWTKRDGMQFKIVKTEDIVIEIIYPENLYMTGSDFGGWDWSNAGVMRMIPVLSHPNAFWRIVYCNAASEFRFSTEKTSLTDFGVNGTAINNEYTKGIQNVKISTAGYYMLYVDLKNEKISVTVPDVYLIGAAIGNLIEYAYTAGKFTVDNNTKKITSPLFKNAGELRMYATCPLSQIDSPKVNWDQMEFTLISNKIEYRGKGEEQAKMYVLAGKKVVLDFSTGSGIIQ